MPTNPSDRLDTLARENAGLRARLVELERQLEQVEQVRGATAASDERGARRGLAATALTEVERARRLLDETERITSTGSFGWDVREGTVAWSKGFYRLLGFDEHEPPSFALFDAAVHPDDHAPMMAVRERAIREGNVDPFECRFIRRDGVVRRLHMVSEAIRDDAGELVGFVGNVRDVTAATDFEERLHQAQKMEIVGQVAGGIAHDFNNLLTVILGGLDELGRKYGCSEPLADVERAARSAAGLTQRLLGFSRHAVVQPELIDVSRVFSDFRPLLERGLGREIEVRFHADPGPHVVRIDENQLQQILMNLSVNARDAMSGRGELDVSVATTSLADAELCELAAGPYVRLSVRDTGQGMEPETARRIFEPFFTTKPVGKGTGLGLAMVHGAVTQAGGAVAVRSEPGRGTTFELYFPAARGEAEEVGPAPAADAGLLRVLLAEDDIHVRRAFERVLESLDCEVTSVGGGLEALDAWERANGAFDLLVTDAAMPDMRGEVLAATLLERSPALRALITTGFVDRTLDLSSFEGRVKVLQKPFATATLAANLGRREARA